MINAVIFDRDGIIIDSEAVNIESAVKTFEAFGVQIAEDEIIKLIGMHPEDYIDFFVEKYRFSRAAFRKGQERRYHELLENVPLFEETIALAKTLHGQKMPLAVTTTSERKGTLQAVKRAGLEGVFQAIVTFEDYTKRKPHPEPYLVTAERLGVLPENCAVLEDSQIGVESAKEAGMKCIAIPHKYTAHHDFSRADLVVASAADISPDLFKNM
jgi:HAD superfamily hydrolase (TIGR01509 family)